MAANEACLSSEAASSSPGQRTYDRHEIDPVEDLDGRLTGIECKWSPTSRIKASKAWRQAYPQAAFEVATRQNWARYLEGEQQARRRGYRHALAITSDVSGVTM